ncbi:MAG: serine/threonine protein kinase [Planctomyces sp.]|nr:serine/threonine protein kinase [Planctomyces sp.]
MEKTCKKCEQPIPEDAPDGLCPSCMLRAALIPIDSPQLRPDDEHQFRSFKTPGPPTPGPKQFQPETIETLRPLFPDFEFISLIGSGGMGAVYQVRQKKLDRMVALKIIRPDAASDPAFAERFNREARTMARLNHTGIVSIHDFGEIFLPSENLETAPLAQQLYYLVMEFVDGANLRQLMNQRPLSTTLALSMISQICEALQFAHGEGIVHRDIKPENILIDTRGRVKIADFGLAKLIAGDTDQFTLTGTHQIMGTPRYMAPEQMEGSRSVDHRADIYSLGVVFYEMLTGEIPAGHFDPPSHKAGVDQRLDSIVLKAMTRDRERRFQSAAEVAAAVSAITATSSDDQISEFRPETRSLEAEERPQALSEFLSYEARAIRNWVAEPARQSKIPFSIRMLSPLLCLISLVAMFFPCVEILVTHIPMVAETPQMMFSPIDHELGTLTVLILVLAFIFQLSGMSTSATGKWTAILQTTTTFAAIAVLALYRHVFRYRLINIHYISPDGSRPSIDTMGHDFDGTVFRGRAFLGSVQHEIHLTQWGILAAGCLIALLVANVFSLRLALSQSHRLHRNSRVPRSSHTTLPATQLAGRLLIAIGACLILLAFGGFLIGMFTATAVTSDADLAGLRRTGLRILFYLAAVLVIGVSAIVAGIRVRQSKGIIFAQLCCVASILFSGFVIPIILPLALWCLVVLNRTPKSSSRSAVMSNPSQSTHHAPS